MSLKRLNNITEVGQEDYKIHGELGLDSTEYIYIYIYSHL